MVALRDTREPLILTPGEEESLLLLASLGAAFMVGDPAFIEQCEEELMHHSDPRTAAEAMCKLHARCDGRDFVTMIMEITPKLGGQH
jgi:hypothetical protein